MDPYAESNRARPHQMIFLSHTAGELKEQKSFMRDLNNMLSHDLGCFTFFDESKDSLPVGDRYPQHILNALQSCKLGVVLFSHQFIKKGWPMVELVELHRRSKREANFRIIPLFYDLRPSDPLPPLEQNYDVWRRCRLDVNDCVAALKELRQFNGVTRHRGEDDMAFMNRCKDNIVAMPNGVSSPWLAEKQEGGKKWKVPY